MERLHGIRVYGEYNWIPKNIESIRPVIFRPSWIDISEEKDKYPDEYGARIINFGIELSYTFFPSLGKTTLAYDCHLYEDGKIVYKNSDGSYIMNGDDIRYDASRPWRTEHGIVLNQEFAPYMSFEIAYTYGASPLNLLYYYENASWVRVGINTEVTD